MEQIDLIIRYRSQDVLAGEMCVAHTIDMEQLERSHLAPQDKIWRAICHLRQLIEAERAKHKKKVLPLP